MRLFVNILGRSQSRGSIAVPGGVSHNGGVTLPELAPRRTLGGIVMVWVIAVVIGVLIGVLVAPTERPGWLIAGLGGCLILSFAIQLGYGRAKGFTQRVAAGVLGSMFVLGTISLGYGLVGAVPG